MSLGSISTSSRHGNLVSPKLGLSLPILLSSRSKPDADAMTMTSFALSSLSLSRLLCFFTLLRSSGAREEEGIDKAQDLSFNFSEFEFISMASHPTCRRAKVEQVDL